jgi:tetratricopeptide (TPR) repeat protein
MIRRTALILGLVTIVVLPGPDPLLAWQVPSSLQAAPRPLRRPAAEVADSLFWALDPLASLDVVESRLEFQPRDFEARWRAARAALVLGVMAEGWTPRDTWFRIAVAHGEQARRLRPRHPDALSWLAAAQGRRAIESRSARENARLGGIVWDLTEELLALDPDHALGNDVRGKLHQEVMKLAGWQRTLGRIFLRADLLGKASWEQSEEHLRRAIEADPGAVLPYLDLGETYMLQDKPELAREAFERGLALPNTYPPDPVFKAQIRRMLERLDDGGAS